MTVRKPDNLERLPHVGPENRDILVEKGYDSYERIARASPFELYTECNVGLSNTAIIINSAMELLDTNCPKCGEETVSPIWGGYPGKLSKEEKRQNDVFCADCRWIGELDSSLRQNKVANIAD